MKRDQMLVSEERKLVKLMTGYMAELGAARLEPHRCYAYTLETPLGELLVSFHGHCLHCRFSDVPRALTVMGRDTINPYTGKYNTYAFCRETALTAFETIFRPHIEFALSA